MQNNPYQGHNSTTTQTHPRVQFPLTAFFSHLAPLSHFARVSDLAHSVSPDEGTRTGASKIFNIPTNSLYAFIRRLSQISQPSSIDWDFMGDRNISDPYRRIWAEFDTRTEMRRIAQDIRGLRECGRLQVQEWTPRIESETGPKSKPTYRFLLSHVPSCRFEEHVFACVYTDDGRTWWYKKHNALDFRPGP